MGIAYQWPTKAAFLAVSTLVFSAGAPGKVYGQSAPSSTPTASPSTTPSVNHKASARGHFTKGQDYESQQKWAEAYQEYETALTFYVHWQIEGALAGVAARVGKHAEAATLYRKVLADPEAQKELSAKEGALEAANKAYQEAVDKVGRLTIQGPAGAECWVDGKKVGVFPLAEEVFVEPGEWRVEAKRDGKVVDGKKVVVGTGKAEGVKLEQPAALPKDPVKPPVEVSLPGILGSKSVPIGIALGAVGLVGIGVGVGLWVEHFAQLDKAATSFSNVMNHPDKGRGYCPNHLDDDDDCAANDAATKASDASKTGAVSMWVVGGVFAAAGGALIGSALFGKPNSPPKVGMAPAITPTQTGWVMYGSF
ncbi:MAG: hypothetical protein IPK82_10400 [Polyangiaceae bacterium]|nr:hypothetical protein [Polyangiaceae bacterium]